MIIKLAFRNIRSRPLRAAATVLAIAVAVAMIFCMFSFKQTVYEFIFATSTAEAGNSDVKIATTGTSDRIFDVMSPLNDVDGIEAIHPVLSLYALNGDEYVRVKGFEKGRTDALQRFDVKQGDVAVLYSQPDSVAVSEACAEHFGLSIGSAVTLKLGDNTRNFYVAVIAENSGYFLNDAPYGFIGTSGEGVERLLGLTGAVYNEIYIKAGVGVDVDDLIERISAIPEYKDFKVEPSKNAATIESQTTSLTAPIVLAGAAVVVLAAGCIVILFMLGEKEKVNLASKLAVAGATKKQIFAIFLAESLILSFLGALIGSVLAGGVFIALLKITLSSTVTFSVSFLKLFGSAAIGVVVAVLSSLVPLVRSFKGTVRENQLGLSKKSVAAKALPVAALVLCAVCVALEYALPLRGVMSAVNLALTFAALAVCAPYALRTVARAGAKSTAPAVRVASLNVMREKRFSRSFTLLTLGMTIGMLLFMAWSLTTNIFNSYVDEFANMAFVSNVRADADIEGFKQVEGVGGATKIVWRTGDLKGGGFEKPMSILGSKDVLDMVDFKFITPKDTVKTLIESQEGNYLFLDFALKELYGVDECDSVSLTIDGIERTFVVGGILSHNLFSGNYIVVSAQALEREYGLSVDTVLVTVDGDMSSTVGRLKEKYADKNYYVVEALEVYRWDRQSMDAVFSLIGTLAVVITVFIFMVAAAADYVGRTSAEKQRSALLTAGMSKASLLKSELYEHGVTAFAAYALSFAVSVLLTSCLIGALRMFGLYFEFMYEAWVVALVGAAVAICYTLLPLVLNFKKGYNVKKR